MTRSFWSELLEAGVLLQHIGGSLRARALSKTVEAYENRTESGRLKSCAGVVIGGYWAGYSSGWPGARELGAE